jgi:hypothetical protein
MTHLAVAVPGRTEPRSPEPGPPDLTLLTSTDEFSAHARPGPGTAPGALVNFQPVHVLAVQELEVGVLQQVLIGIEPRLPQAGRLAALPRDDPDGVAHDLLGRA